MSITNPEIWRKINSALDPGERSVFNTWARNLLYHSDRVRLRHQSMDAEKTSKIVGEIPFLEDNDSIPSKSPCYQSSCLSILAETSVGVSIEEACIDLCNLANRLDCRIVTKFNDVELWAHPGDNPKELAEAYEQAKEYKNRPRIAHT